MSRALRRATTRQSVNHRYRANCWWRFVSGVRLISIVVDSQDITVEEARNRRRHTQVQRHGCCKPRAPRRKRSAPPRACCNSWRRIGCYWPWRSAPVWPRPRVLPRSLLEQVRRKRRLGERRGCTRRTSRFTRRRARITTRWSRWRMRESRFPDLLMRRDSRIVSYRSRFNIVSLKIYLWNVCTRENDNVFAIFDKLG